MTSNQERRKTSESLWLLQENQWGFLIEGSRVVVVEIRFVRIGNLRPRHWKGASALMEPVKRFLAELLPGSAL